MRVAKYQKGILSRDQMKKFITHADFLIENKRDRTLGKAYRLKSHLKDYKIEHGQLKQKTQNEIKALQDGLEKLKRSVG